MCSKVWLETFKKTSKQPDRLLKKSGAEWSILDREDIVKKIKDIKQGIVGSKLPNIYLIHGDLTDNEMNGLYNHPKVKTAYYSKCKISTKDISFWAPLVYGDGEHLGNLPVQISVGNSDLTLFIPNLS